MNIKKDDLEYALNKNEVEKEKQEKILADLKALLEKDKDEKEDRPKHLFVGARTSASKDHFEENGVFLFKILENEDPVLIKDRLNSVMASYNASKKGRKSPAESYQELLFKAPKKYFKESGLKVPCFEPIRLIDIC